MGGGVEHGVAADNRLYKKHLVAVHRVVPVNLREVVFDHDTPFSKLTKQLFKTPENT